MICFYFVFLSNSSNLYNVSDSPEHGAVPLTDQHDQDTSLSPNEKFVLTAKKQLTKSMRRIRSKGTISFSSCYLVTIQ